MFPAVSYDLPLPAHGKRQFREAQDNKQSISEAEKRAGMRASLRQLQKECVNCKTIPISMIASDCPICGRFRINFLGFIKEERYHEK